MPNLNILIVEDDPVNAVDAEMIIEELGYNVAAIVDNSDTALEFIYTKKPDLVLMDININGELSGVEVAQQIKEENIPVIFMTAYQEKEIYDQAKQTLMAGYLVKPFNHLSLLAAIEVALSWLGIDLEDFDTPQYSGKLEGSFFIKKNNEFHQIKTETINWIESDGNYCILYAEGTKYPIRISLKKLLLQLPEKGFIQIQKRFGIRIAAIDKIDFKKNLVFIGGKEFPIGRTYKEELLKRFKFLK